MVRITSFWVMGLIVTGLSNATGQESKPPQLTSDEKKLADEATRLNGEGFQLYQQGKPAEAIVKWQQSLEIRQKLFPAAKYPDGHSDLAQSINNLGLGLEYLGKSKQALPFYRQSLEMYHKLFPAAKFPDGHPYLAQSLLNMASILESIGRPEEALPYFRQCLEIRQKLYPASRFPDGHSEIDFCLSGMGRVLQAMGQPEQARDFIRQSLEMTQKLFPIAKYPDGHMNLATSLNEMASVLSSLGEAEQALPFYRQSLEMNRKLFPATRFPDGHLHLANSLNSMGFVLEKMGQLEQALDFFRQSLEMTQKLFPVAKYPDGHLQLAVSLNNMGFVLGQMGQAEHALPYYRQSLQMSQKLFPVEKFPDGHVRVAVSLNNMGLALEHMNQPAEALPFCQQSLEMNQKLFPASKYPNGHPDLALSLNNMGFVLHAMGQAKQALPFYRQSLEMNQKLFSIRGFPNGHPSLARSFDNLGTVLSSMGEADEALPFYRQGLEMNQKLFPVTNYPDGHPHLAISFINMGLALEKTGQPEQALPFYRQSLEVSKKLYSAMKFPDGHPYLATGLINIGCVLEAIGRAEEGIDYIQQSLRMQQQLLRREMATASEEAAFDKLAAAPPYRDAYLGITRTVKSSAENTYTDLWPSLSMVTRLLEQRQANARAAGTVNGVKLDRLRGLRRRIDQLLQDTRMSAVARTKLLVEVAKERDDLERELIAEIPALKHWQKLDQLGPADLVKALPLDAVFVDVIRYTRFEFVGKNQRRIAKYVAFVLARNRQIQRIELDEAKPIDKAVQQWRAAIDKREQAPLVTAELNRLIWEPIAPHLPPGTKTIFLAPDGDLSRMPWAALPIDEDRVLLEEYALAQVPHGTFLLDQLMFPREHAASELLVTVGSVDYGPHNWPALPGTAIEVKAIAALAPSTHVAIGASDATLACLMKELPHARFAHLATHGEFKADDLAAEKRRAARALETRSLGNESHKIAAKNPLSYVGLVLSDGKVMSGLSIVDLQLQNLKLVTLSACETGLGELTGGEGVQGLQRAFHLAGCENVVCSLWKVNDDATAALMRRFYYHLWEKKEPPIQALRLAQLELYRNPTQVAGLLRGNAPKFSGATKPLAKEEAPKDGERAATKLWAAFVLSGVGR